MRSDTNAWQNAILTNLQLSDASQNATITSMQASMSALTAEVDANTAKISTIVIDAGILQTNITLTSTDIVNIDIEFTIDEAQIQENTDANAQNAQKAATNAEDIPSLGSELQ